MKLTIGLGWAVTLVGAFFLGLYFQSDIDIVTNKNESQSIALVNNSSQKEAVSASNKYNSPLAVQASPHAISPVDESSLSDIIFKVKSLSAKSTVFNYAALAEAYQYINTLDENQLYQALTRLKGLANDPQNNVVIMLLSKYADYQPQLAMDYVLENISLPMVKYNALGNVISSWAKKDAESAFEWFQLNKTSHGTAMVVASSQIYAALARQDLTGTVDRVMNSAVDKNELSVAISSIAGTLASSEEFEALLSRITIEGKNLEYSVLSMWAFNQPGHAVEWLATVNDDAKRDELGESVYKAWSVKQPILAADWYLGSGDEEWIQTRAERVVNELVRVNASLALEWLNTQSNIDKSAVINMLITRTADSNPDFAIANLHLLESHENVVASSHSIYQNLRRINPTRAQEFLASSAVRDELLDKMQIMKNQVKKRNSNK